MDGGAVRVVVAALTIMFVWCVLVVSGRDGFEKKCSQERPRGQVWCECECARCCPSRPGRCARGGEREERAKPSPSLFVFDDVYIS
jgi:hypothetical protein